MISVVVTGRNDGYGGRFTDRLFRTCRHNTALLHAAGIEHELLLVEWNPVPDQPILGEAFTETFPNARAIVVSPAVHRRHVTNPYMPFDEMAAKNVGIRRAAGDWTLVTNADILFGRPLVDAIRAGDLRADMLYRAHRIDIDPGVADEEIEGAVRPLRSGEGTRPPCYYLGAGGDFCLAATSLWRRLGGFNQRIRFSTRAKDWQFFLSAAARDIPIEFLGRVYHLDHEGGFRNTAVEERAGAGVHFGGLWDIEFGLPLATDPQWGFPDLAESSGGDRWSTLLQAGGPDPGVEAADRLLESHLAWPAGTPDLFSALAAHAVFAAAVRRCPLAVSIEHSREAVALAGLSAVGEACGVSIHADWSWAGLSGLTLRPFRPVSSRRAEPSLQLVGDGGEWTLSAGSPGTGTAPSFPARRPVLTPAHNPMLGRRLLRAWLHLQRMGARRLALFGAGGHTLEVLEWGLPDEFTLEAILVSEGGGGSLEGLPVVPIDAVDPASFDAVVLSSIPFEAEMAELAARRGFRSVLSLWSDWPRTFWRTISPS